MHFIGGKLVEIVDRRVVDDALPQEDPADVVFGADDEHAALLRGGEELEKVGQRDLVDGAAHRARRRGAALRGDDLEVGSRGLGGGAVLGDDLEDAGADEDAVALFQLRALDLLAVDERAVGRAEIFDDNCFIFVSDPRVLARDHVLDEDHVEIARATDDDLLVGDHRELAALVFAGDESQRKRPPLAGGLRGRLGRRVMHVDEDRRDR